MKEKPTLVTIIGAITVASGVINLFWGLGASLTAASTLVGVICVPIFIVPTFLGIFEIIYALKLLGAPQPIKPSTSIAVFEILCVITGNMFSVAVGILSLIFYNDLTVKQYFELLNGQAVSPPAPPVVDSVSPIESTPAQELPNDETPKPKRSRKIA